MNPDHLPPSQNVEDRRGEPVSAAPRFSLLEMLARGLATAFTPDPTSRLAKDAGVDDIKE